jgi:hypothetical protein
MGLDIHAASHLRYVGPIPRDEACERLEEELEAQGKDLHEVYFFLYQNDAAHKTRLTGMKHGLYEYTEQSKQHGFRAGSYSGYNWWRRQLCQFALGVEPEEVWQHPRRYRGKPFVELIDFTDCDGRIGTKVAAKLAQDFREHKKPAADFASTLGQENDWLEIYDDFALAFELAAQNGAVEFR